MCYDKTSGNSTNTLSRPPMVTRMDIQLAPKVHVLSGSRVKLSDTLKTGNTSLSPQIQANCKPTLTKIIIFRSTERERTALRLINLKVLHVQYQTSANTSIYERTYFLCFRIQCSSLREENSNMDSWVLLHYLQILFCVHVSFVYSGK